jgi:hypothetical protein
MAIDPRNIVNTNPASSAYPNGSAKNSSTPYLKDGTPITADVLNDIWGFLQKILLSASITPSGSPDNVQTSQYLNALDAIIDFMILLHSSLTGTAHGATANVVNNSIVARDGAGRTHFTAGAAPDDAVILSQLLSAANPSAWNDISSGIVSARFALVDVSPVKVRTINNGYNAQITGVLLCNSGASGSVQAITGISQFITNTITYNQTFAVGEFNAGAFSQKMGFSAGDSTLFIPNPVTGAYYSINAVVCLK